MSENSDGRTDLDYVLLAGILAGSMTAIATMATLIAKPVLIDFGRKLPLPDVEEFIFGKPDGGK
ncbi:MAG: hypothetical protein J7K40_13755 [candidate division Zixibacteria bacterium]|nr:hypothetical protein [candidate division Zixibacteria bacterium]